MGPRIRFFVINPLSPHRFRPLWGIGTITEGGYFHLGKNRKEHKMQISAYAVAVLLVMKSAGATPLVGSEQSFRLAQMGQMEHKMKAPGQTQTQPMDGMKMKGMKHLEKTPSKSALKPAKGAKVKILSPRNGKMITGSTVDVHFKMTKGAVGSHVHAYIDDKFEKMLHPNERGHEGSHEGHGALTDIQPGQHTLTLIVVAEDHQMLNATDMTHFMLKEE